MKLLHTLKIIFAVGFGIFIGLFCFFTVGQIIFPSFYKPYVVLSGSMEPFIKTGSVVFVHPKTSYSVGDVITFSVNGSKKNLVTHRISKIEEGNFVTKGDANEEEDLSPVSFKNILGSVSFSLPYIGYGVDFAKTPQGFIALVIIPATIIVYEELKNMKKELSREFSKFFSKFRKKKEEIAAPVENIVAVATSHTSHSFKSVNLLFILVPLFGVGLVVGFSVTKSFFLDREKNSSNTLQAWTEVPASSEEPLKQLSVLSVDTSSTPTANPSLEPTPTTEAAPTPSSSPSPTATPEPEVIPEPSVAP